jgi:hypothetical protein
VVPPTIARNAASDGYVANVRTPWIAATAVAVAGMVTFFVLWVLEVGSGVQSGSLAEWVTAAAALSALAVGAHEIIRWRTERLRSAMADWRRSAATVVCQGFVPELGTDEVTHSIYIANRSRRPLLGVTALFRFNVEVRAEAGGPASKGWALVCDDRKTLVPKGREVMDGGYGSYSSWNLAHTFTIAADDRTRRLLNRRLRTGPPVVTTASWRWTDVAGHRWEYDYGESGGAIRVLFRGFGDPEGGWPLPHGFRTAIGTDIDMAKRLAAPSAPPRESATTPRAAPGPP